MYGGGSLSIVPIIIGALIGLGILAAILTVLSSALGRLPAEYRLMEPGMVFLTLIPLFGTVWLFFVVSRLSRSYQAYWANQGRPEFGDCGRGVGLGWAICGVVTLIPFIGILAAICALVCMILFLSKASSMKNQIGLQPMAMQQPGFSPQPPQPTFPEQQAAPALPPGHDAAPKSGGGGVADELKKLNDLRVAGVITEEEFLAHKQKLLS